MKRSLAFVLAVVWLAVLPAAAEARVARLASFQVIFEVQNANSSKLACGADGGSYQIKGFITGPKAKLSRSSRVKKRAVTLYLHGLGFGEWFWHLSSSRDPGRPNDPVPLTPIPRKFDYAIQQAQAGHVSVTIDRLGYDASGHPEGLKTCLGAQASIAHQVITHLRKGTYSVAGGKPQRFGKVALVGHSIGAQIAMLEAYSFKDVDALGVASFSFQNQPRAQLAFGPTRDACLAGGAPAEPGTPSGYAYFGQTEADFASIMFSKPPAPAIVALRNRDPCGDVNSIIAALVQQQAQLPSVKVPVLVICGTKDALYAPLGCESQGERFTRSRRVDVELVRGAGHAITIDRGAASFRRKISRWLARRGF